VRNHRGGILVVDKPAGMTSHDVVHIVRRALGGLRVGHTGTLDPFATGVMALVLGRATRLAQFYAGADKEYAVRICLGAATDTYDGTGTITRDVRGTRPLPDRAIVESALASFVGTHDQVPPPFSAKKEGGTPAYERARKGQVVTLEPVQVTAFALDVANVEGEFVDLRVHCSAGYYVRSLGHDLGQVLGVGAHVTQLRRTRSGVFRLDQSLGLEPILRDAQTALDHLVPLDALLPDFPVATVSPQGFEWVKNGRPLGPAQTSTGDIPAGGARVRLLSPDGQLVAIADRDRDGLLHPGLVLV
jgi:tRNA pseudouridine55 synthase